jgi:glycosyltransferase involved in cell wall biosynthesis
MPGQPARVAFVLPSLERGGMETVLLRFAAGLDRTRFAAQVVVLAGGGPLLARHDPTVPLRDLGAPRLRRGIRALDRHLRRERVDVAVGSVVHVNLALVGLTLLPGRHWRTVLREASLDVALDDGPASTLYRRGVRELYPRADAMVASSARMANELATIGVARDRLHVVPNPVDVDGLRDAARTVRREDGAGRRFVAVGRLDPAKGFDLLPALLADLDPDDRIRIIGDGPQRDRIVAAAQQAGVADRLTLAGWDEQPGAWMAGADALLVPSRYEGMPNVVLEALALGTPVLATGAAGGVAELAAAGADVRVVEGRGDGPALRAAARAVAPRAPRTGPRASLLPERLGLRASIAALEAVLDTVTRTGADTVTDGHEH